MLTLQPYFRSSNYYITPSSITKERINTKLIILTQVFICGNDSKAKQRVMDVVRSLGLTPLDKGSLVAANEIENYPLQLFPMWKFPFYLSAVLCVFFFLYCVIREVIYPYVYEKGTGHSVCLFLFQIVSFQ